MRSSLPTVRFLDRSRFAGLDPRIGGDRLKQIDDRRRERRVVVGDSAYLTISNNGGPPMRALWLAVPLACAVLAGGSLITDGAGTANASPNSMVGRVATYETQMKAALAIQDPTRREAAIIAAREQLAQSANKPLTAEAITRVDGLLGIQSAPPQLGAVQ
jgi:hypothetical protein